MESIKEKLEKSKGLVKYLQNGWFFGSVALILGIFAVLGALKLTLFFHSKPTVILAENSFNTNVSGKEGSYVASKNGGSYYFPWCGIAGRIKNENKVWFASRAEAEKAGYKPTSNCHGLK